MTSTTPPRADEWQALCLESMLRLKRLDSEEAALLARAASQLPRYRDRPPHLAAADLLANCVVQPSLRAEESPRP